MTKAIPAERMQLSEIAPKPYAAMFRLTAAIDLVQGLRHLIDVRASQVNGCAFCIDMHWQDARAAGETEARLYVLDAWRESSLYSERERTALELCEAITQVAEGHVSDEVWERASAAFDRPELAQLVFAITATNAWNRLMIAARVQPGHYRPGQFGAAPSKAA
jgi:AhpD family alkylhydroperoxidase